MKIVSVLALASIAGMASAQAVSVGNNNGDGTIAGSDPFSHASYIWNNGDTDGTNGYSNATSGVFGASRSLLDDFEVTDAAGWILNSFSSLTLWAGGGSGIGTGYNLTFWSDAAGSPGAPMVSASVNSYTEDPTGRTWFSRPEMLHEVTFDDIILPQGRYWVEMQVIGPDNNFQMVRSTVTGSESWVNYDDLGGLQPGSAIFGAAADLAYTLGGEVVPAPGALALLGLGGIAAIRRRR